MEMSYYAPIKTQLKGPIQLLRNNNPQSTYMFQISIGAFRGPPLNIPTYPTVVGISRGRIILLSPLPGGSPTVAGCTLRFERTTTAFPFFLASSTVAPEEVTPDARGPSAACSMILMQLAAINCSIAPPETKVDSVLEEEKEEEQQCLIG